MPPEIEVTLDNFDVAQLVIAAAVKKAIAELAFRLETVVKANITANGQVDTGAMRASIYLALGTGEKNGREEAVAAAIAAGQTPGKKSGKPHKETPIAQEVPVEGEFVAKVAACVEYAIYQEFGTVHASERPFMAPAVADVFPLALEWVRLRVDEALGGAR